MLLSLIEEPLRKCHWTQQEATKINVLINKLEEKSSRTAWVELLVLYSLKSERHLLYWELQFFHRFCSTCKLKCSVSLWFFLKCLKNLKKLWKKRDSSSTICYDEFDSSALSVIALWSTFYYVDFFFSIFSKTEFIVNCPTKNQKHFFCKIKQNIFGKISLFI